MAAVSLVNNIADDDSSEVRNWNVVQFSLNSGKIGDNYERYYYRAIISVESSERREELLEPRRGRFRAVNLIARLFVYILSDLVLEYFVWPGHVILKTPRPSVIDYLYVRNIFF